MRISRSVNAFPKVLLSSEADVDGCRGMLAVTVHQPQPRGFTRILPWNPCTFLSSSSGHSISPPPPSASSCNNKQPYPSLENAHESEWNPDSNLNELKLRLGINHQGMWAFITCVAELSSISPRLRRRRKPGVPELSLCRFILNLQKEDDRPNQLSPSKFLPSTRVLPPQTCSLSPSLIARKFICSIVSIGGNKVRGRRLPNQAM